MMKIEPPADDFGTEQLRRENRVKTIKETEHVEPYPAINRSDRRIHVRLTHKRLTRKGERRKQERRSRVTETPFDTRAIQEQRRQSRRGDDEGRTTSPPEWGRKRGIDIKV